MPSDDASSPMAKTTRATSPAKRSPSNPGRRGRPRSDVPTLKATVREYRPRETKVDKIYEPPASSSASVWISGGTGHASVLANVLSVVRTTSSTRTRSASTDTKSFIRGIRGPACLCSAFVRPAPTLNEVPHYSSVPAHTLDARP